jgi:hypothetical protein
LANLPDESPYADGGDRLFHRADGDLPGPEVKSGGAVRSAAQLEKDAAMESGGTLIGNNGGALQGQTLKVKIVEARPF